MNKSRTRSASKMKKHPRRSKGLKGKKSRTSVDFDTYPSSENYIYLVIYTHGEVLQSDIYTQHTSLCSDDKTKKPAFVNNSALHYADVDYIGLITHAPLGCYDWSNPIRHKLGLIHYLFSISDRIVGLSGSKLRDKIKKIDRESFFSTGSTIRQNDVEQKANILTPKYFDTEEKKRNLSLSRALISKNPDSVYALGEYRRTTSPSGENTVLNKRYTIGDSFLERTMQNIFVVAQSGGILEKGEYILGSKKFNDYKNALMDIVLNDPSHPMSSHPMFSIDDDFIRTDSKKSEINTISLIYFLRACGYKNIYLIDYSCNICQGADAQQVRGVRKKLKGGKTKKRYRKKRLVFKEKI